MYKNIVIFATAVVSIVILMIVMYVLAEEKRKRDAVPKDKQLSAVERQLLYHFKDMGYTQIKPKLVSISPAGYTVCAGVMIVGKNLPDLVIDTPFHLFNNIKKEASIDSLLNN